MTELSKLAEIRERLIDKQRFTLEPPGWAEDGVVIRLHYRPLEREQLSRAFKGIGKAKDQEAAIFVSYQQIHVDACETIEITIGNNQPVVFKGFGDSTLGESLGQGEEGTARGNVLGVFLRDGDVISFGDEVIKSSGFANTAIEEVFAGE